MNIPEIGRISENKLLQFDSSHAYKCKSETGPAKSTE